MKIYKVAMYQLDYEVTEVLFRKYFLSQTKAKQCFENCRIHVWEYIVSDFAYDGITADQIKIIHNEKGCFLFIEADGYKSPFRDEDLIYGQPDLFCGRYVKMEEIEVEE